MHNSKSEHLFLKCKICSTVDDCSKSLPLLTSLALLSFVILCEPRIKLYFSFCLLIYLLFSNKTIHKITTILYCKNVYHYILCSFSFV